ncbi:uncharacterized protein LOC111715731 isoform X2 [Eurytemora carolleeae]|uniref:uncharacterized protein LOC111715731 isoform X2 n=1 Tax=Eurytemora carolleeae TaxID=1294199 RepID=UPI000C7851B7|nr:uncharacterized protein LOC111715731 isoform X2 [Eurytemora carolleeae]|eukprot:XP_023346866.1 uncharacterized protein LOC111715731 isoform X2 [Eurytemora affinis]
MLNVFSDRMAEIMKKDIDLEEFEIKEELISKNEEILPSSIVKNTCTVNLYKNGVKIDKTEIQDVLNTVIQDTVENKPVFDPDFHTELIIKHENEHTENMDEVFEPEPKKSKKKNSKGEFHCFDCEYVATRAYHLKTHVESKHEGVRYPCWQCEFAATTAGSLKIHV